ncbi:MAG: hypothetical protein AAFV53_13410 [Myxococcota bacterium]
MTRRILCAGIALWGLTGCPNPDPDPPVEVDDLDGIVTQRTTASANDRGRLYVKVDVGADDQAMMVYVSGDDLVSVEGVYDPSGEQLLDWRDWVDEFSLTSAVFVEGSASAINWPIRSEEGSLTPGTWQIAFGVIDDEGFYIPNADLDVVIQTRGDPVPGEARVSVELVYTEGVGNDEAVVSATEAAVARWSEIWAGYGLSLDVTYRTGQGLSDQLTDLSETGSDAILNQSTQSTDNDITVLIGETIGNLDDVYGIAGGIPWTPTETDRSAVVISWLANAGGDGNFDEEDIRLYGETLAHEVGHYMGLFHPVEDGWTFYDALSDTADCSNVRQCEGQLGDNLMFPYTVCDFNTCIPQDQLSDNQQVTLRNYIGAR